MLDKLQAICNKYEELSAKSEQPDFYADPQKAAKLLREKNDLEPIVEAFHAYNQAQQDMADAQELMADPEMKELCQETYAAAKAQKEALAEKIQILLLPKDPNDEKNVIMEIRGGVGGEESALFAHSLLLSMGLLINESDPVAVRGPLATRYVQQFLRNVAWGDVDFLILDLPPGTGDIQLTIVQTAELDGVVVVTTPQEVALIDARKAIGLFERVETPILGVIENMSYFQCPSDGKIYHIFGEGGGEREAAKLGVPLLGKIPLDIATRSGGDEGRPVALEDPEQNPVSAAFRQVAEQCARVVLDR